jgi:hypothetical protein
MSSSKSSSSNAPAALGSGCLILFGLSGMAICTFFVVMAISDLVTGDGEAGLMVGMLAFFGFLDLGAGAMTYWGSRLMRRALDGDEIGSGEGGGLEDAQNQRERRILAFARSHSGRLTVSELAVESPLGIEESRAALEGLVERGVADTWVSEHGQIVYVFPAFFDEGDKHTARDPLEGDFDERLRDARGHRGGETVLDLESDESPEEQGADERAWRAEQAPHSHRNDG